MIVWKDAPMRQKSNMKIGGVADFFIEAENKEELPEIYRNYREIFLIGNGTNTLLSDGRLQRAFVSLKKLRDITELPEGRIRVGAGLDFKELIRFMREKDYGGLENLAGIPGTVGGLTCMNAGAYGGRIFDCIESVGIMDENLALRTLEKEEIKVSYRYTEIRDRGWVIVNVTFRFGKGFDLARVKEIQAMREAKQPLNYPSLGSTFKNPDGAFAARLITDAGLKGRRIGDAQISEKHPNFIINLGNAAYSDVTGLIELVCTTVRARSGIALEKEIVVVE